MSEERRTRIALLGSTGSIGTQALQVIDALPDRFTVVALAAGRQLELLEAQCHRYQPTMIYADVPMEQVRALAEAVAPGCQVCSLVEMASAPEVDLVIIATAGRAGLEPTLAAARAGKRIALANKEVLVMAGQFVQRALTEGGGVIRPVDSEHSAIWQSLAGETVAQCDGAAASNLVGCADLKNVVRRLIVTGSGGAFRDYSPSQLAQVTPEEALQHPTWLMGQKVTIDSATLVNKALEVIEAHWLFGVPYDRIEVLIHRESVVHSLIEFVDGSLKAQLAINDMRLPIQYALTYPKRLPSGLPPLEIGRIGRLNFEEINLEQYPAFRLAMEAGRAGGASPAVMAAADEEAVDLFLSGQIRFLDIVKLLEAVMERYSPQVNPTLAETLEADEWARHTCRQLARQIL